MPVHILTYHSIDDSGSVISTAPMVFSAQMGRLKTMGFHVITLSQLIEAWDAGAALPPSTAVITFDDGYENFSHVALPVLREHKFPATLFVVSGMVGKYNDWSQGALTVPRLPLMGATQLQEAHALGIEIGAHSISHRQLTGLNEAQLQNEVLQSKSELQQLVGTEVSTFAYPYGGANERVRDLVEQHYRAAVGTKLSVATVGNARFALPRVDMYYYRTIALSRILGGNTGNLYLKLRAAARNLRAMKKS